jgi:hypothetical protein
VRADLVVKIDWDRSLLKGISAAAPIAAPMELERESSPAPLDAGVQDASREVAADTVLAAGAPDESTP